MVGLGPEHLDDAGVALEVEFEKLGEGVGCKIEARPELLASSIGSIKYPILIEWDRR